MKINYNFLGVFIIVCAIFNVIGSYYVNWFSKFLIIWYSIGWVIMYFIVINCDMKWKKRE